MENQKKPKSLDELFSSSSLAGANAAYLEAIYEQYLANPAAVDPAWRNYFDGLPKVNGASHEIAHSPIQDSFRLIVKQQDQHKRSPTESVSTLYTAKQMRVIQLINAYRFRGHVKAKVNPLTTSPLEFSPLPRYELTEADLDTEFDTGPLNGPKRATLRNILNILEKTYCGAIGSEFMHMTISAEKRWLQERLEGSVGSPGLDTEGKKWLLRRLTAAEGLERYLHTKYVGQKRFSLEGAESLIPMLDQLIISGTEAGLQEFAIGMAHRGRLNVLVNTMGKIPTDLFSEFEGKAKKDGNGSGDVKYHQGFSSNVKVGDKTAHLALAFNPSHLEIVGPVVEGSVRARQDRRGDKKGEAVIPIIIHGDAAFAGQGVVMETLNMSQSRGYSTKGTVHIVVNNQIGFTTSNLRDARSSLYCTDVAKMVNAPIFHVNGDDPEAVLLVAKVAMEYRKIFRKDVIIDMFCYRRHGHNEADEPVATQPMMYKIIKSKPTTREMYAQYLEREGIIEKVYADKCMKDYRKALASNQSVVENLSQDAHYAFANDWTPYLNKPLNTNVHTKISLERIQSLMQQMHQTPDGFELHPTVKKIYDSRLQMADGSLPVDWGFAENMAYASLLEEGHNVRLSGQDCGRGTFFHRHSVLLNQKDGRTYVPLRNLKEKNGHFLVINSLLSEEAVLAFEYGYSSTDPRTLTIWEAQFGDFANGAQVVIDQFISAGEQKWSRLSGLVMLLPHGYEGQGPEHSSGRLERYLQLCAQHNMRVCIPTNAAQIFHLLRQQMLVHYRKPLIVMTPKSLLRHKLAASPIEKLTTGRFQRVIQDTASLDPKKVKRVIICYGKIYYDLYEKRLEDNREDVAIIRLEQLYPFPENDLKDELLRYPNAKHYTWCQDEPKNQGAWFTSQHHIRNLLGKKAYLEYTGRPFSASPATGSPAKHVEEHRQILQTALGYPD
ncbi:MAG: 2-oxoglutarate dehydrogenase E1 component [Gammaproteobacteria bacterium]|nr:2-oxoglutarate dehydrogenase E1 component [Gammaproteobacteria bacterium]